MSDYDRDFIDEDDEVFDFLSSPKAVRALLDETKELKAENTRLRAVLEWYLGEYPCPGGGGGIHADVVTNGRGRCPEESDDPMEYCASARFRAALEPEDRCRHGNRRVGNAVPNCGCWPEQ